MKHVLFIALTFAVAMAGCKKKTNECTYEKGSTVASAEEEKAVTDFLTANGVTNATEIENSGLYYVVDSTGTGDKPANMCSYIQVTYIGQLPNGKVFDQTPGTSSTSFQLGGLVEGWKRTLPLIKAGSKIRIFIPSSMGYGATGVYNSNIGEYSVPPNSMLVFTMKLIAVGN
ncbi:MAG: FKBP-type peptidyl-prolyl cis-trans isomerase [Lacibacter sp.]